MKLHNKPTRTIPIPVAKIQTTSGLTRGRSVRPPDTILPTVLVMPTTDIKRDAFAADRPRWVPSYKKDMENHEK